MEWHARRNKKIAMEIRELGDQFRPKLREGWVKYLASAGDGQSFRQRLETGPAKRIIVEEGE